MWVFFSNLKAFGKFSYSQLVNLLIFFHLKKQISHFTVHNIFYFQNKRASLRDCGRSIDHIKLKLRALTGKPNRTKELEATIRKLMTMIDKTDRLAIESS